MINKLKRRWQIKTGRYETPFDAEVPFWLVSLVFHLALILVLTRVLMPGTDRELGVLSSSSSSLIEEPLMLEEMLLDEADVFESDSDDMSEESEMLEAAAAASPTLEILAEEVTFVEAPVFDTGTVFAVEAAADFEAASPQLDAVAIRSNAGQSLKSTGGAIDRIAEMIHDKMAEGDLMVVWIFDQSASLSAQRSQIAQQFDRVYRQLQRFREVGGADAKRSKTAPLITDLYQFGESISPLLAKPSSDLEELRGAVEKVVRDDSGTENVMQAVMSVVTKYRPRGAVSAKRAKRNMMILLVTDEAGDDVRFTDEAVRMCVEASVSVSTIGIPAPFGREETTVKWVDPDPEYDQKPQLAVVDQGAETPRPERLRLEFVRDGDDFEQIDSGFGPFYLTRLCYESGGLYFAVHPNRTGKRRVRWGDVANYASTLTYFFDPDVMRRYQPSYVSVGAYNSQLASNRARMALVKAAESTRKGKPLRSPRTRFPRHDEGEFSRIVSRAQKDAAFVGPELERLMQMLKVGEADRENELDPRWQAGYDLAMGRALAARLRASIYNEMLALIKTSLKFDPPLKDGMPNNTWVLKSSDSIETGSRDAQLAEKARAYLKRVVDQHPDTPWALLASQELRIPIGWEWTQRYTEPMVRGEGNGNNQNNLEPGPMENRDPMKTRDIPKL